MSKRERIQSEKYSRNATDYQRYGLKKNPFHPQNHPQEPVDIFANFHDIYYLFTDKINWVISRNYNENLILFGDYGQGKSHIIKYTQKYIEDNIEKSVTFNTQIPQKLRFRDLYHNMISTNLNASQIADIFSKNDSLDLSGPLGSEVQQAIRCILDNNEASIAWKWLSGAPTLSWERQEIKVSKKLDTNDEYCVQVMLALIEGFVQAGIKIIFIGIDEMETAKSRSRSEMRKTEELLELIRRLIDGFKSNTFFMLASTLDWKPVWIRYGALHSRFPQYDSKDIPFITEIEVLKVFVFDYLTPSRDLPLLEKIIDAGLDDDCSISESDLKRAYVEPDDIDYTLTTYGSILNGGLFPFTNSSLEILLNLVNGNPRNIVKSCHRLLELLIEDNKVRPDDTLYINEAFMEKAKKDILSLIYEPGV